MSDESSHWRYELSDVLGPLRQNELVSPLNVSIRRYLSVILGDFTHLDEEFLLMLPVVVSRRQRRSEGRARSMHARARRGPHHQAMLLGLVELLAGPRVIQTLNVLLFLLGMAMPAIGANRVWIVVLSGN